MENKIKNKYKVCILGASLDTGNMGVSALASSLISLILYAKPDAEVKILRGVRSSDPQEILFNKKPKKIEVENYRLSLKAPLQKHLFYIFLLAIIQKISVFKSLKSKIVNSNPFLTTVIQADFIGQIWGGDSFSDIYGIRRFLVGSLPSLIAIFLNKKHTLLPQTYGPYKYKLTRKIAKYILKHSDPIISRDQSSITYINNLFPKIFKKKTARFCPDVAFTLDIHSPEKLSIQPKLAFNQIGELIGLNISGLLYNGGYSGKNMFNLKIDYRQFIEKLIKRLMVFKYVNILLIPHTVGAPGGINNDLDASLKIIDKLSPLYPNRLYLVQKAYNQYEIKAIIKNCTFFIGSRMHACIAACSQGIPTIGVAYSKKFKGVFDSVGIGELVQDARSESEDVMIKNIIDYFDNRVVIKMKLNNEIDNAKHRIFETFDQILN